MAEWQELVDSETSPSLNRLFYHLDILSLPELMALFVKINKICYHFFF